MVRLYKDQFGRGPTKARTWAGPDTLVCTLDSTFTPAERSLIKLNEHQRVRDIPSRKAGCPACVSRRPLSESAEATSATGYTAPSPSSFMPRIAGATAGPRETPVTGKSGSGLGGDVRPLRLVLGLAAG